MAPAWIEGAQRQGGPVVSDSPPIIVGAGPAGCRAAATLAAAGLAPIVLDEAPHSGGQIYRHAPTGFTRPYRALYGFDASKARRLHATFDGIKGSIDYRPDTLVWDLKQGALHCLSAGRSEELSYRDVILAPGARDRIIPFPGWTAGGSLCAADGAANPRLVAPAFARAARAAGADIREHTPVTTIERDSTRFRLRAAGGIEVSAATLVNVAGAWGHEIAARFGESVPEDVVAPNMCVTEPVPYFMVPNFGVCGGGVYVRQTPRGNVIFGGGRGIAERERLRAYPLALASLDSCRQMIALVPRLRHAQIIRTWTGIEGVMPDVLPVIGPSRTTPGLFHAFGFSGHGFQLGPAMGAVLTELILDGASSTPIDAFDIGRFASWIDPRLNRSLT